MPRFLVIALLILGVSGWQNPLKDTVDRDKRPALEPPEVEIVERDARRLRALVTTSWRGSLEESLSDLSAADAAAIIGRATAGLDVASKTFDLPQLGDPLSSLLEYLFQLL